MINDGYIYIERSETGLFYKNWNTSKIEETYTRSVKVTTEEFISNIYQYLLSDLLGFSSTLCNTIINSTGEGNSAENMQFDKLISGLSYEEENTTTSDTGRHPFPFYGDDFLCPGRQDFRFAAATAGTSE